MVFCSPTLVLDRREDRFFLAIPKSNSRLLNFIEQLGISVTSNWLVTFFRAMNESKCRAMGTCTTFVEYRSLLARTLRDMPFVRCTHAVAQHTIISKPAIKPTGKRSTRFG